MTPATADAIPMTATAIVKLTVVIQLLVTAVTVPAIQAAVTQLAATAVRVLRRKKCFQRWAEVWSEDFKGLAP